MFNFKLPTPEELRDFQIEHYTEMMKEPRSFEQKIFLRKQLYQFKTANDETRSFNTALAGNIGHGARMDVAGHDVGNNYCNSYQVLALVQKRGDRSCG